MTEMVRVIGDEQRNVIEQEYASRGEVFLRRAQAVTIDSPEAAQNVDTGIVKGKEYLNAVNNERKKWAKPLQEYLDNINQRFTDLARPFEQGLVALNGKLKDWMLEQQRALDAEKQAKIAELKDKLEDPAVPPSAVAKEIAKVDAQFEREKKQTAGTTKTGMRFRWVYELTDFAQLPEEYKTHNDAAIKADIAGGKREIPGLRIYQEPYMAGKGGKKSV